MPDGAEAMARRFLAFLTSSTLDEDLWAPDVVIELPFAPPGRPDRIEGREAFLALARQGRGALPVHFEDAQNVVIHQTLDPDVVVVEYEMAGTLTTTGQRASARFIGVLTARDGQIVRWREYQNPAALARVFS